MKIKKRVLISGIGGDIAQGISRIIRENFPSWKIFGSDITTKHSGKLFVDKFLKLPKTSFKKKYISRLNYFIKNHKIDLFIPTSEKEILFFDSNKKKIKIKKYITSSSNLIKIGVDKYKTNLFLKSINLPHPWTYVSRNYKKIPKFPCIAKPRFGKGSKNIMSCHNFEEAKFFSNHINELIFQQNLFPKSKEITCAVYRFKNKKIKVIQLMRKLKESYTCWAQVIKNSKIEKLCIKIAKKIGFYGSANFQLILTKKGPMIFEINPRFSSTVLMRNYLGFTDLLWSIEEKFGLKLTKNKIPIGKIVSRYDEINFLN